MLSVQGDVFIAGMFLPVKCRHLRIVFSPLGQMFCVCLLWAIIEGQIGNRFFFMVGYHAVDFFLIIIIYFNKMALSQNLSFKPCLVIQKKSE